MGEEAYLADTLIIAARFSGPPGTGNGGYVAGRLAALLAQHRDDDAVEVTLRRPVPLDRALAVAAAPSGGIVLRDGDAVLAEARQATLVLDAPTPPDFAAAEAAARAYLGFTGHAVSGCFVCGPARGAGDGLRIFAGPLGDGRVAAPWIPDASLADAEGFVSSEFVWAVLDCPGAFALMGRQRRAMLLGRLTARLAGRIRAGERSIVIAWPIATDGRRQIAGSAVFTEAGALRGLAQATWFEVASYGRAA
jgi:hypothetical protein